MDPEDLHYYQVRFDSWNVDHLLKMEKNYLHIVGFCYGLEKKRDGTKHVQGMFINEYKLTQNEKIKLRLSLKTKLKQEFKLKDDDPFLKNSVAVADAKNPHALLDYCLKEMKQNHGIPGQTMHKVIISDEIMEYIRSIPVNNKKQFTDELTSFIETLKQKKTSLAKFYMEVCEFYIIKSRSLPRKQQLLTLAVKYGFMEVSTYLDTINLVSCYVEECPYCTEEGEITT